MPQNPRKPLISDLDKRVLIERPATADSPQTGGRQSKYVPLAEVPKVWARLEGAGAGEEFDEHGKLQPVAVWKVTIRRRPDLTTKMRIVYGTAVLYIKDLGDDHLRSEFMEITCKEYPQ